MPNKCCRRMMVKLLDPDFDEEPVFLLRAQDALAPAAIEKWIEQAEVAGVDPAKVKSAKEHLAAVCNWQANNAWKVRRPDSPHGKKAP